MILFVVASCLAAVLTAVLIPVLRRAEFLDIPNHRSSHTAPVPRGGGLAVVSAVAITLLLASDFDAWPVVWGALALASVGLIDDIRSLPGGVRLAAQVITSCCVTWWLVDASDVRLPVWVGAILVVAMVGYVNAFNFMDGVNGIASLNALVIGAYWGVIGADQGRASIQALGLVLAGAAFGFLPWNAPRARVFLGDVGSYGLGLVIGAVSMWSWVVGAHWLIAAAPLIIYGVDTGWVLLKRAHGRRPLTEAHREHVYQRLVDGGWTHLASAALSSGMGLVICVVAWLTWDRAPMVGMAVIVLLAMTYLAMPRLRTKPSGAPA